VSQSIQSLYTVHDDVEVMNLNRASPPASKPPRSGSEPCSLCPNSPGWCRVEEESLVGERLTEDSVDARSRNRRDDHGVVSMFALNAELIDEIQTVATARMVRVFVLDTAKG
jgi:hypothetical protein